MGPPGHRDPWAPWRTCPYRTGVIGAATQHPEGHVGTWTARRIEEHGDAGDRLAAPHPPRPAWRPPWARLDPRPAARRRRRPRIRRDWRRTPWSRGRPIGT